MYADIIVDISSENLDRTYQYSIPESLEKVLTPGDPVVIPFGKGTRQITGYVVAISDRPKIDPARIKPIAGIPTKRNSIEAKLIGLAWWIKEQFGSTMNEALKCVIPVKDKVKETGVSTIYPAVSEDILREMLAQAQRRHYVAKERFFKELLEQKQLDRALTVSKLNISPAVIKKAEEDGLIKVVFESTYRNPVFREDRTGYVPPRLNEAQEAIAGEIKQDIRSGIRKDYLLHGITGSGKTEVYMDVIESVVAAGKQVIMLIPEIALTYQTVKRFYLRFGDRISIMNSKLSKGERYDQLLRARRGDTDIVIGPRSALFTPFEKLGLIIIDEEHETSYHSETAPRYNAREVALKRAEMEGASVILGSATPSLEAYSMARGGRLKLFTLDSRACSAVMPRVYVADMREELKNRNRTMFSAILREKIAERLERHEQVMLFLNRRGYSGSVSCRCCGHVIKCPHCDISLTLHNNGTLVCHYCGYSEPKPAACPKCASPYIGSFGIGTQKVEELISKEFPQARVLRMDADSTKAKNGYEEILSAFANEEADILIGTQMIVKGHDFHKVTLVGILLADLSLYSPDFRSGERTFELLTQASGRAGRGSLKGEVVIQTYNPEHYCIVSAAKADYTGFYEEEMAFRRLMKYPPARPMLSIVSASKDEACAQSGITRIAQMIARSEFADLRSIGPADAPLAKANDIYRKIIYIRADSYDRLVGLKNMITDFAQNSFEPSISVQFSFN